MTDARTPRTAAGRALLKLGKQNAWPFDYPERILAIEAEAAPAGGLRETVNERLVRIHAEIDEDTESGQWRAGAHWGVGEAAMALDGAPSGPHRRTRDELAAMSREELSSYAKVIEALALQRLVNAPPVTLQGLTEAIERAHINQGDGAENDARAILEHLPSSPSAQRGPLIGPHEPDTADCAWECESGLDPCVRHPVASPSAAPLDVERLARALRELVDEPNNPMRVARAIEKARALLRDLDGAL